MINITLSDDEKELGYKESEIPLCLVCKKPVENHVPVYSMYLGIFDGVRDLSSFIGSIHTPDLPMDRDTFFHSECLYKVMKYGGLDYKEKVTEMYWSEHNKDCTTCVHHSDLRQTWNEIA